MTYTIATFYHFFDCPADAGTRNHILRLMEVHKIKGTVLVTPEGLNSTVAGTAAAIAAFMTALEAGVTHGPIERKISHCDFIPFARAKVKLKPETISIGEVACPTVVGTYLDSQQWNNLLADPSAIIIDTRNDYEVHLGTFRGAVNPNIANFRELPAFVRNVIGDDKTRKIGTFCTGGIRCEKFTAWLLAEGYTNVYHLKGGILKYFEETTANNSQWIGECFVFDDRIAVDQDLAPSKTATLCPICSYTLSPDDVAAAQDMDGGCPHCQDQDPYRPDLSRAQAAMPV